MQKNLELGWKNPKKGYSSLGVGRDERFVQNSKLLESYSLTEVCLFLKRKEAVTNAGLSERKYRQNT